MNPLEKRLLYRELARRGGVQTSDGDIRGRILASLFDKQQAFVLDESREKSALCPRRAGKTTVVPAYAFHTLLGQPPGRIVRYWAITQDRAYQLMWAPILRAAEQYGIRVKADQGLMTFFLPNGSEIRLVGADKAKEAEKKRGDATVLEIVDECSLYGDYLQPLVEEVIGPSLMDHKGTLCMMGTPGILWTGYWFRVSGPAGDSIVPGISRHAWDVYDNPFMPHAREEIERLRVKRNWSFTHPTYLREYRGQWVKDSEGLFYAYDPARNDYDGTLPKLPPGEEWEHVLGWDIGWDDAMALVVWAYHESLPDLFERRSWKKSKVLIARVADEVRSIEESFGHIPWKVADAGGGGKLTVEEMAAREHLYFEPAEKRGKAEIVRFMNDDFQRGHIKVIKGSALSHELSTLGKDPDDETKEDPRQPNHCCDSALYSYRRARHYRHESTVETPAVGTNAYFDTVAKELERRELEQLEQNSAAEWWEK